MEKTYYVKQLTDEGRMVDPPEISPYSPYYNSYCPVDSDGYETESEAVKAIESALKEYKEEYVAYIQLTVVKIYTFE